MICYFASRAMKILALASTGLTGGLHIRDDGEISDTSVGQDTYSGYLCYGAGQRLYAEQAAEAGNYILMHEEPKEGEEAGKDKFYTIIETETDPTAGEIWFYAESGGLDLIGEMCEPYTATGKMPLSHYISKWIADSGFRIGVNEVSSLKKALAWDDSETAVERILSTAESFGCEVSYRFVIEDLSVKKKYLDFHVKRGDVTAETLRRGKDFEELHVKKSLANIATSLRVTGGVPDGSGIRRASDETFTWVKFSDTWNGKDSDGEANMSDETTDMYYVGIAAGKAVEEESEDPADYLWGPMRKGSLMIIKPSVTGHKQWKKVNGTVRYTWIMFATDDQGSNMSDQPTDRTYVGYAINKTSDVKSTLPEDYTWIPMDSHDAMRDIFISPVTGGIAEGGGLYTWIRFADDEKGSGISNSCVGKNYIGITHHRTSATESTNAAEYIWKRISLNTSDGGFVQAESAYAGIRQANGKFIWVKFARTATGESVSSVPTGRPYIGIAYDKNSPNASFNRSDYEWALLGEDDSQSVTLVGVRYDDGDIYVESDGRISSRTALAKYTRYLSPDETGTGDGHITADFESEATSQQALLEEAIAELKKRCAPEVTYEIELPVLPENIKIGDTIRLADFEGKLYLSARVLKTNKSYQKNSCIVTLGEFTQISSGISDQVAQLAKKQREAANAAKYQWIVYADSPDGDGIRLEPNGAIYMGTAFNMKTPDPDLTDPTLYEWTLINGDGDPVFSVVITAPSGFSFKRMTETITLTAHVFMNGEEIEDLGAFGSNAAIRWYKNGSYLSAGTSITVAASEVVSNPCLYEARFES